MTSPVKMPLFIALLTPTAEKIKIFPSAIWQERVYFLCFT
jgi:hypothetical protein